MILQTKHLIVIWDRDVYFNDRYPSLRVLAIRRHFFNDGEIVYRLRMWFCPFPERYRRPAFSVETFPAWQEVPSVLAEYRRTMQPYEMQRTPWYLRQRRR